MELVDGYCFDRCTRLCSLFTESVSPDLEFIKKRFEENWTHFVETLALCEQLDLLERVDSSLFRPTKKVMDTVSVKGFHENKVSVLRETIRSALLYGPSVITGEIKAYLTGFSFENGHFVFTPTMGENLSLARIRDLLISLEVIEYDGSAAKYRVIDTNPLLHLLSRQSHKFTPNQLSRINEERQKVGLTAELAIVEFEKQRLIDFPHLVSNIDHVSEKDVTAGYDIVSYETPIGGEVVTRRYIEVKAISEEALTFHWSAKEIAVAKGLGYRYYLYLLPMRNSTTCLLGKLKQIQDPYNNIFLDEVSWRRTCESLLFGKN